jgi:5-methylcytosine-specific restriction endonuclease McrA
MAPHPALRNNASEPVGRRRGRCNVNTPRIKRQYVWEKTGGLCWYCGARLYYREQADTEMKKRLIFTADHLHPRAHGGRGRANKVPACKYCNSHKSSRSVEQFRQWVHALVFDKAKRDGTPFGKQGFRRWKIKAGAVVFYFELARLSNSGAQLL